MARKTKNPPSETDVLLTNYIDQTLGNTGKIGWSSEEVSGMVQGVIKRFLERCLESEMDFHLKNGEIVPREKAEPEAQEATVDDIAFAGVGRNDPCPCGSGRKYKMCHGQNEK